MDGQKTETKIIHPGITDSRVMTYLNQRQKPEYVKNKTIYFVLHSKKRNFATLLK